MRAVPRRVRAAALAFAAVALGTLLVWTANSFHAQAEDSSDSLVAQAEEGESVALVAPLHDAIHPATASYIDRCIEQAETRRAACLVVELDTPGGLDSAMRDIVKRIFAADVPVVVYVAPSGSRAASAGLWILLAGHVAVMAPGTTTGAAHPVPLGRDPVDETLATKFENDSASFIRSVAHKRGRNAEWAERAVRESVSASDSEALELGVVDLVEPSVASLLDRIDGRRVEVLSGSRTLRTRGARIERLTMGWRDRVLAAIANPNIAYLLLMLGTMGIMMELWNPGAILPGVLGGISMLLAFFALQVLPVNSVGLLLLALGVVLLLLEIKVTSYGALTIGGIVALTLGSIFLFDSPRSVFRVSWSVLVPTVVAATLFFLFIVSKGLLAQRARPVTGSEGMVGEVGTADSRLDPTGRVFVHGEYWFARAAEPIEPGARIEVVAVQGRELVVRTLESGAAM
jgi:membrane-bound serine protease (ClpP class)